MPASVQMLLVEHVSIHSTDFPSSASAIAICFTPRVEVTPRQFHARGNPHRHRRDGSPGLPQFWIRPVPSATISVCPSGWLRQAVCKGYRRRLGETFAPAMETFGRGRDFAAWLGLVPLQLAVLQAARRCAARTHRRNSSRRGRSTLRCPNRGRRHGGVTQFKMPPAYPARFSLCRSRVVHDDARPTKPHYP
jgi:hypothetical protein